MNVDRKCNFCDKTVEKEKFYHEITMTFNTFMKDKNTGQLEEVTNMYHFNCEVYCTECFDGVLIELEKLFRSETNKYRMDIDCVKCNCKTFELGWYHQISLDFLTFVKNKNNHFEEQKEVTTKTVSILCDNCFDDFIKCIDNFINKEKGDNNVPKC